MVTAEELTVAIQSEGVAETTQDLEGVERKMENTADAAGDSAAQLEGFSEKFAGAMSAAVTALAVGAAGLLSKVPVLGETFAGLAAIVSAVAFQMDGVLRPVLNPLTNLFFQIADAIFNADGIIGDIIGTFATLVSIAAVIIGTILAVSTQVFGLAATFSGLVSVLGTVIGAITTVAGAIVSLPAVLVAAVAAIVAFAAAYLLNWRGTRDKTNQIIGDIVDFVVGGFNKLADMALSALEDFASWAGSALGDIATQISDWASGLADDAYDWGVALIQSMIDGMVSLAESIAQAVENVINGMINTINTALDQLPEEVTSSVGFSQISEVDFSGNISGSSGGSSGTAPGFRNPPSSVTSSDGAQIDGRQLSESTGRYRSDPGRRRGL